MPDDPAEIGAWSDEFSWPIIGIHAALTPDGKVLTFGTDQNGVQTGLHIYDVWDPVANTHVTLEHHTHSDIFCSAGLIVPDTGEFLISGGDSRPLGVVNGGIPDVNVFDYRDESLTHSPTGPMEFSRWYGTAVTLGTGQIMMLGGREDAGGTYSPYPEIYTPGYGFRTLTGAYIDSFNTNALYPRVWLSSSGKIWTTAEGNQNIYAIDPTGSGAVDMVGSKPVVITWQMPEVMFAPDKVLLVANDGSAWVMDISGAQAVFTQTDAIGTDRMWSNLTVLPDGRVMISGGSAVDNQLVGVEQTVEFWDPHTGHWSVEADAAVARLYHSTALLLPDGTVLNLGGGAPGPLTNTNGQIFHPDYLYGAGGTDAARPVISAAPAHLEVGDEFTIHVTGGGTIQTLALMPFGSVTHSINMDAQRIELSFHVLPNGDLQVDLPDNANLLTPGYWMLFAIDSHGTPSVASTIKIESELPDYQPNQLSLDPGVAFAINGDVAYDGFDDSYALVPHAATAKHGSVMSNERLDLSHSFDLTFEVNLGANDAGGDGVTFVLHNDPAGNHALGGGGGALGAMGIVAGIAIEFDTYYSADLADDIPNDHTTFLSTASGAAVSPVTDLGNIEDGAWHTVHLQWNGTTLAYAFDGIAVASLAADSVAAYLGGSQFAYFGFTGGSGTAGELGKVRIDKMDGTLEGGASLHADRADVARPPSFIVNGNASYDPALNKYAVTPDQPQQHGSVMTGERIDVAKSFVVAFDFKLGDGISADGDGIALVLHNDALGSHAIGGTATALGAVGIANGLALEFDTSQGTGSPSSTANGVGRFVDTDNGALGSPVTNLGHIDDGQWHHVKVVWNAAAETLSYSLDGADVATLGQDIVATYLGGSHLAYLGITGATGGLSELEQVRILRLDATAEDGKLLHLVGPNAGPTTVDDSYAVAANGSLTVSAGSGVLANDRDPDSDPLLICDDSHLLEHIALLAPANGALTINADGSFTYTPRAGFVGIDHFTYCAEDFAAACASGEVTIAVGNLTPLPNFVTNGNASADAQANSFTLTPDAAQQLGSVMSATAIDLTSAFTLTFEINLGGKDDGADGAAFVLHNDPAGSQALGWGGGGLGAMGIRAGVAIEFDTYDSDDLPDDIPNDHTSFFSTASGASVSPVTDLGNIEDGDWHNVVVAWNGASLSYSFDGVAIANLAASSVEAMLGGAQSAYFGFTASTGGLSNEMQVRVLSLATSAGQMPVTVAGYLSAGTFPAAYTVTLADTGANIGGLTAAQFASLAGNGVDVIDATDNVLALSVAAWRGLGTVALSQGDQVTLTDSGTNLAGLTAAEIGALAGSGVDRLDATNNALSLSVAGWRALGSVALTPADVVTLADTGVNLAGLSPTEIGALAGSGVDRLDATDNALSLSVAAYRARGAVALTPADVVTLADTGANLATLTQAQIGALAGSGVDRLDATNNALSLTLAQYLALGAVTTSSNDVLTITGTAANDTILGRTNPDVINGSGGRDVLLGQGGNDRLSGGIGNDVINGGAGNDVLSGGAGNDTFFFNTALNASSNVDTITDFFIPGDTIQLENTGVFTKLALGTLTDAAFYKGAAAHDASDRIIYNPTSGALLYDSNGNAAGGAVKFATLGKSLAFTHLDFFVV